MTKYRLYWLVSGIFVIILLAFFAGRVSHSNSTPKANIAQWLEYLNSSEKNVISIALNSKDPNLGIDWRISSQDNEAKTRRLIEILAEVPGLVWQTEPAEPKDSELVLLIKTDLGTQWSATVKQADLANNVRLSSALKLFQVYAKRSNEVSQKLVGSKFDIRG